MLAAMSKKTTVPAAPADRWSAIFSGLMGALLGLSLLKFGNPVILDGIMEAPRTLFEWIDQPWPLNLGYVLLGVVLLAGLKVARFEIKSPSFIVWLPLAWFGWQLISATQTVDSSLTAATLPHFAACTVFFYLGYFALSQVRRLGLFWLGLLAGFILVLAGGFNQQYGGMEETRQFVEENEKTHWRELPLEKLHDLEKDHILIKTEDGYATHPEVLKRLAGKRISSTLIYPNAFAGAILLFLPMSLAYLWETCGGLPRMLRQVLVGLVGYMGFACLYWSGSKAGWLIALVMGVAILFKFPLKRVTQLFLLGVFLTLGLFGFFLKYEDYFRRGATSTSARFDYWSAAVRTFQKHPVLGTGPGTFMAEYRKLKRPESEMTRLAHNDYLQQASDSGLVGFALFFAIVSGSVIVLYRNSHPRESKLKYAIWLGVFGWALQSFVEFGLYIPALAWPVYLFTGWLWGQVSPDNNGIDTHRPAR